MSAAQPLKHSLQAGMWPRTATNQGEQLAGQPGWKRVAMVPLRRLACQLGGCCCAHCYRGAADRCCCPRPAGIAGSAGSGRGSHAVLAPLLGLGHPRLQPSHIRRAWYRWAGWGREPPRLEELKRQLLCCRGMKLPPWRRFQDPGTAAVAGSQMPAPPRAPAPHTRGACPGLPGMVTLQTRARTPGGGCRRLVRCCCYCYCRCCCCRRWACPSRARHGSRPRSRCSAEPTARQAAACSCPRGMLPVGSSCLPLLLTPRGLCAVQPCWGMGLMVSTCTYSTWSWKRQCGRDFDDRTCVTGLV